MLNTRVALTSLTDRVALEDLVRGAAALQMQITRDFTPAWGASAVISAAQYGSIPYGTIPLLVCETHAADGTDGFHRRRDDDSPYLIVPFGPSWSLAASHMILRMLADPYGSTCVPGPSPLPGQGLVEYLVDCCGPCQDVDAAYQIDGVLVSDFCLPAFYTGAPSPPGTPMSFTGALTRPLKPSPGGLVTWFADDGLLYQSRVGYAGRTSLYSGFSMANRGRLMQRECIDQLTPARFARLSHAPLTQQMADVEADARRACLTHRLRLDEELAWRFAPAAVAQPAVQQGMAADDYVRSAQHRDSAEVATTERTAS